MRRRADDEAVAAHDLFGRRIPHDELPAWDIHRVELIYVVRFAGTSSGLAESTLAQSPYLHHGVGGVEGVYDIYLVVSLVGVAKQVLRSEFLKYGPAVYFVDYFLHGLMSQRPVLLPRGRCLGNEVQK